jgi:hypothetical protein
MPSLLMEVAWTQFGGALIVMSLGVPSILPIRRPTLTYCCSMITVKLELGSTDL